VGGDPIGAGLFAEHGGGDRIRLGAPPRLPDRGDVINVHIQALVAKRRHWGIR
jgi:hypothetical protein